MSPAAVRESPTLWMIESSDSIMQDNVADVLIADLMGVQIELDGEDLLEYALEFRLSEISSIKSEQAGDNIGEGLLFLLEGE